MFGLNQPPILAEFVEPNAGYAIDIEQAKKLKLNTFYEVSHVSMGQSSTSVTLKDVRGSFNSVHFKFYDMSKKAIDIYTMPEFNPYMRMQGPYNV